MGYGSVSVPSNTAVTVIAANPQRHSYLIVHFSGTNLYLGDNSSVTTATGLFLSSWSNLTEDSGGTSLFKGAIYAISEKLSKVRYWERER